MYSQDLGPVLAGKMYVLGPQWPVLGNICKYHFNPSELNFPYKML